MLKIGQKAPDFTLKSDAGSEVSLKDFKGKRVVLFFFPKANTPG
jgi:thioredoxin-dependent peroxiredoxin